MPLDAKQFVAPSLARKPYKLSRMGAGCTCLSIRMGPAGGASSTAWWGREKLSRWGVPE